jgi:hypothetical protein
VDGEIALKSPKRAAAKAHFEGALTVARKQQAKSWELRGYEHGAALARSGQTTAGLRASRPSGPPDRKRRSDRAFGVVLLRDWIPEQRHQAVAKLLGHFAAHSTTAAEAASR